MLCAGVGAFYATAQWTREQRDSKDQIAETVTPPERMRARPAAPAAVSDASAAAGDASTSATDASAAVTAAPSAAASDASLSIVRSARSLPAGKGELFANLNWTPPPPPPAPAPAPAPPPKPAAPVTPPLPFTFVGMLERGAAKPEAFLAKGEALLVISVGDTLDNNTYRVDSLNANEIVMTYLPLNTQQTLSVPGASK